MTVLDIGPLEKLVNPPLMGVLNVTPDSFSDGGRFNSIDAALAHARQLIEEHAMCIDVGGESTRPGSTRLSAEAEQARVLEVIKAIALLPEVASGQVQISIDTMNASTAELAVAAGASIVNDVSGGQADPAMFETVAKLKQDGKAVKYILGHWNNFEAGAGAVQDTEDIVAAVVEELGERVDLALAAGVKRSQLIIDPGLGFGKDNTQNSTLLQAFDQLATLGLPILIGPSRKRFIAAEIAGSRGIDIADVTLEDRDHGTAFACYTVLEAAFKSQKLAQLWGFRVHNVAQNREFLKAFASAWFAH